MSILEKIIGQEYELQGPGRWLKPIDEPSSLVIDKKNDYFWWNAKEIHGDALVWLVEVKGYSLSEAKKIIDSHEEKFSTSYTRIIRSNQSEVTVYPKLVNAFWERGFNNRKYWYKRLLNDDTINRFKLGFNEDWYYVPIYVDGAFHNFQMRREDPKKIKKYYKHVDLLLFNSDVLKMSPKKVYFTEGIIDCILLSQYGLNSVSKDTGASGWSDYFYSYFNRQREIYLLFDNDIAGRKGANRVARRLGEYRTKIYTFEDFDKEGYDVIDFFREGHTMREFFNIIESKSYHVFERY